MSKYQQSPESSRAGYLMKKIIAVLGLSVIFGCGRSPYNSSTSDALKYGSTVSGTANFLAARTVMLSSCFACHGSWSAWTEAEFVSNGRVVATSLADSILYTRIRGNSTGVAGNMPQNGSLSSEDIVVIKNWILGM